MDTRKNLFALKTLFLFIGCHNCVMQQSSETNIYICNYITTGWERAVHVSRCPALYSGRIFVPLCRELIIFMF